MFSLVLVSRSHNGKRKLILKGRYEDKAAANALLFKLEEAAGQFGNCPDYRILGPVQLKKLQAEIKAEQDARRAKGAKKAAATRAKRGASAFILCPVCKAKSKKLCSEFGGLQTRRCQRGHEFEYDKWIADRQVWMPLADPYHR